MPRLGQQITEAMAMLGYFGHKVTLADGSESEANSYTAYRCTRADLPSVKKQVIANLLREVVERIEGAIKIYDLG